MNVQIKNFKNLVLPSQAHPNEDAAFDVVCVSEPTIVGNFIERFDGVKMYSNIQYIEYNTNLQVAPPEGYHLKLYSRSSISSRNLLLCNGLGLIDNGYRGSIILRLKYVFQPEDLVVIQEAGGYKIYGIINQDAIYHANDKCGQLELCQNTNISFELVDKLVSSQRAEGGFGSSDSPKKI
jgi:dUTPase